MILAAVGLVAVPAAAQETYQDTKLVQNELNGTARYVGMGGAMEALGADLSAISSNPAGLGLFRRSQINVSGGMVAQSDADTKFGYDGITAQIDGNKSNASFDQIGFVWAHRSGRQSFLNLGFNYHKSRNFDQLLTAFGQLGGVSQGKLSAMKYQYAQEKPDEAKGIWNGVDENFLNAYGTDQDGNMYWNDGKSYLFGQYQKGYIGSYEFNISGNINDRVYLGATMGFHDVNYRSNSYYVENYQNGAYNETWEQLKIDGDGFDVKLGAIFRPIEASPFRIGVYVNTPVFYDLTLRGAADLTPNGDNSKDQGQASDYDFKLNTPWKFGLSLGHTVGDFLALGATYEYSDYGTIDNRVKDGGYYDSWYDDYYETSSSDDNMNDHVKANLKGVSTLKLGMEYKPVPEVAIRLGYNYMSPIFDKSAFRDGTVASYGSAVSTSTDYTNWKSTNRLTLGLGYQVKKFSVDLAYQYSATDGDFYPFGNEYLASGYNESSTPNPVDVSFKRHQLLLTLGYRF